ncbi:MAG: hypothetical protein KAW46_00895 [candidate division Zixibacteria bacterium]|nr:hypothetical protein [candidate division Zixibacteria bacterium]
MTPKPRLIIPDTDVIVHLHELGIWDAFITHYSVHVPKYIVDQEANYFTACSVEFSKDKNDALRSTKKINLVEDIDASKISQIDLNASDKIPLLKEANNMGAMDGLDRGEEEVLAAVFPSDSEFIACLIDRAAIRCAVLVGLKDKCISVDTALKNCGLGRSLPVALSEMRFQKIVKQAKQERVQKLQL